MGLRVLAVVLVTALVVVALVWSRTREEPFVVSGFIEADQVRLGSRVGGRVAKVHVEEGELVEAGEVLIELEPFDLVERRAEAAAEVARRRSELEGLRAGFRVEEIDQARARRDALAARLELAEHGPRPQEIATGRAWVELAEARLHLARQEHERTRVLQEGQVASEGALDEAITALRVAEAELAVRRQELALLEEGTREEERARARAELAEAESALALVEAGYRTEDVEQAAASLAAAEAAVAALDRRIAELELRAPSRAVVEALDLEPGDLVAPDAPALALLDPSHLWVRAYVPESRLTVQPGQRVEVAVDAFPGERFEGRVRFVAREAEFTPRNVQTPEERSKQVFRIEVELSEGLERLRPGMAADVFLEPED